jgi:hypothetical protein
MKTVIAILLASLFVGLVSYGLAPGKTVEVDAPAPLTYDNPLPLTGPTNVPVGGTINIQAHRCQNTDRDITVEISVYFQSADGKTLIPYIAPQPTASGQRGPSFTAIIHPGCTDNVAAFPLPLDLAPNTWRVKGQVCFGGVAIDRRDCVGWQTQDFTVGQAID